MRALSMLLFGLLIMGCAQEEPGLMSQWDAEASQADGDAAAPDEEATEPAGAADVAAQEEPDPKPVPMTKREAKLVDKQQAMADNPSLVEVENKVNASDPLTAIAQSYFTIGSRAQVAAMQHNIRIQRELNDRWPTFEEFQQSLQQNGVKLSALYPYQMYAYDQTTGGITVLEDRAEMKRQYEAAGREYPYAD